MRFLHRPVTSFEDAARNFEQLEGKDILDQTAESVLQLAVTGTARKVAFGTVTLAWTASNTSANVLVTHGLGRAPVVVIASAFTAPAPGEVPACNTFTYTTTQFTINGDTRLSGTFNCTVAWIAIG